MTCPTRFGWTRSDRNRAAIDRWVPHRQASDHWTGVATSADKDVLAPAGPPTFAPGETTKTVAIEVKGDGKREANETFYLDLSGPSSNGLFAKNRGLGAILNDD